MTLSGCQAAKELLSSNPVVEECRDIPKQDGKQACVKITVKDKPVVEQPAEVKSNPAVPLPSAPVK